MGWYVIQVSVNHEAKTANRCCTMISKDILRECFIPEYIRMKRYNGSWHEEREILFPGYVFMISEHIDQLNMELKRIPEFARIIGKKKSDIFPLDAEEIAFLKEFAHRDHTVAMSHGYIEGDRIIVCDGPMKGKEGLIVRINRHKRIAEIQLKMFNKIAVIKVGLEIISKSR